MSDKRFQDTATYLVNFRTKQIYVHPNVSKLKEAECDRELWWNWLTYWGGTLNENADQFKDYQFTDQIDIPLKGRSLLNEPITDPRRLLPATIKLPVNGEFSFVSSYDDFLKAKLITVPSVGFEVAPDEVNPKLYPFQRDIVRRACKAGRYALFEECGLGKTAQELETARLVVKHTGGKVIIFTVLGAIREFLADSAKFGIPISEVSEQSEVGDSSIVVTNYDSLHKFDLSRFAGVFLDESSILKNYTGATKQALVEACAPVPYRFCGSATPAPNDHLELGNHSEFLGIMPSSEMIMRFFINDTMKAGGYRLKEHAKKDFWRWLTSWAVCVSRPSDLGAEYDMPDYNLPELQIIEHSLAANAQTIARTHSEGKLLPDELKQIIAEYERELALWASKPRWQYHSRVTIWKDPVVEMQRTKNHGLLHKNFTQRAEACRQGMPDYLVVFRKWPIDGGVEIKQHRLIGDYIGTNPPTEGDIAAGSYSREVNYSIAIWQRYASPVWFDIDQTDVLNYEIAKDYQDEKHICPLQLDVIGRAIDLWSMPGETVFSPFAGVGSELYKAVEMGRKAVGVELKEGYHRIAARYLEGLESVTQLALPGLEIA